MNNCFVLFSFVNFIVSCGMPSHPIIIDDIRLCVQDVSSTVTLTQTNASGKIKIDKRFYLFKYSRLPCALEAMNSYTVYKCKICKSLFWHMFFFHFEFDCFEWTIMVTQRTAFQKCCWSHRIGWLQRCWLRVCDYRWLLDGKGTWSNYKTACSRSQTLSKRNETFGRLCEYC